MTKPWEETWTLRNRDFEDVARPGPFVVDTPDLSVEFFARWDDGEIVRDDLAENAARARLASAAPDMARVLMAVEWNMFPGGAFDYLGEDGDPSCPCCHALPPPGLTWWTKYGHGTGEHAPDCALDAALRKAGVR